MAFHSLLWLHTPSCWYTIAVERIIAGLKQVVTKHPPGFPFREGNAEGKEVKNTVLKNLKEKRLARFFILSNTNFTL
jgi:hypothetical protein